MVPSLCQYFSAFVIRQARRPDSTHVFMQEESMTETMQCIWELLNASQMKDLLGLMNTQLTNYNSGSHCLGLYPAYYTSELNFYFDQQSKDNQCKCILSTHSVATADSCVRSPQPPPRFCRHALLAIVVSRALKKQVKKSQTQRSLILCCKPHTPPQHAVRHRRGWCSAYVAPKPAHTDFGLQPHSCM